MHSRFHPDPELTEILGKLWELDTNKCYAGQDFDIDLQGKKDPDLYKQWSSIWRKLASKTCCLPPQMRTCMTLYIGNRIIDNSH